MATSAPGQSRSPLFFVRERLSHRRFLVYTGTEISVIPPVQSDRQHCQCGVHFQAANGVTIATFGQRSLTLNLGLRRPYRWIFTIADVSHPILGADFLAHHGLLVDVKNHTLIDSMTNLKTNIAHTKQNAHGFTTINPLFSSDLFNSILLEYPELTRSFVDTPIKHDVVHHIETSGPPVSARTHQLPPERLTIARSEFWRSASFAPPPVIGLPHCTWSPEKQETGDLAEITGHLIESQCQTGTQSLIFKTLRLHYMVPLSFQNST